MNKRFFRTTKYICVLCLAASVLGGCGLIPTLELTEEEGNLITEYAAGKLIEYVKGHPGGLMEVDDIDRTEVNPGLKKEEEPEPSLPPLPADGAPAPQEGGIPDGEEAMADQPADVSPDQEALVDVPAEAESLPTQTIAQALGMEGVEISYDHYEVTSTYPENAQELAFSMKAAPGKELLIVHFNLNNPGDGEIEAHSDSSGFKVRLLLNGKDKLRGDVTFHDNDLMNYHGLLTPGSSVDSILVFEIPEGSEVSSMDLLIVGDDGEQKYNLI